jgi:hypothetical protein
MAFVLLRPQACSKWKGKDAEIEIELKKFSRPKLPGFARPEWVQVVDELPVDLLAILLLYCSAYVEYVEIENIHGQN